MLASHTAIAEQRCQSESIIATTPTSHFQVNTDGTVVDKQTNLMWRTCLEGITDNSCEDGDALELDWTESLLHVAKVNSENGFAGHKDWRLPNISELITLFELQCFDPAINLHVFPNSPSSKLWTSSPSHFIHEYAWYADFRTGVYTYLAGERADKKHIRLVRDNDSNP